MKRPCHPRFPLRERLFRPFGGRSRRSRRGSAHLVRDDGDHRGAPRHPRDLRLPFRHLGSTALQSPPSSSRPSSALSIKSSLPCAHFWFSPELRPRFPPHTSLAPLPLCTRYFSHIRHIRRSRWPRRARGSTTRSWPTTRRTSRRKTPPPPLPPEAPGEFLNHRPLAKRRRCGGKTGRRPQLSALVWNGSWHSR